MSDDTKAAMSDAGAKMVSTLLIWRLAILELIVMCVLTYCFFYQSWMGGTEWGDLSPGRQMTFKIGALGQIALVVKAFLSQTISTLKKGGTLPPDPSGGTTIWQRRQTQVDTVQERLPAPPAAPPQAAPGAAATGAT